MEINPEAVNTGLAVLGAAIGSKEIVVKLLGPTADYVGAGLKTFAERRVANVQNIFRIAVRKLGNDINKSGSVPPRVLKGILAEGSFCDDPLAAEYFGGVLASSRTDAARDDRGVAFLSVVANLSTYQIQSHYIFYSLFKKYFKGARRRTMYGDLPSAVASVYIPFTVYSSALDLQDGENPVTVAAHCLFGLSRQGLISTFAYGQPPLLQDYASTNTESLNIKDDGMIVSSSPFGAELFMYVHGKADYLSENDFFGEWNELKADVMVTIPDGSFGLNLKEKYLSVRGSLEGSF